MNSTRIYALTNFETWQNSVCWGISTTRTNRDNQCTTLNIVLSVTCFLELHNTMSFFYYEGDFFTMYMCSRSIMSRQPI